MARAQVRRKSQGEAGRATGWNKFPVSIRCGHGDSTFGSLRMDAIGTGFFFSRQNWELFLGNGGRFSKLNSFAFPSALLEFPSRRSTLRRAGPLRFFDPVIIPQSPLPPTS